MENENKSFAVLIDADNISSKYLGVILDEMSNYGVCTYRRIYGDWTNNQAGRWKQKLLEYSITPIQQFGNTVGKNSTDSALIIDAMDILYEKQVEGFCIVSSDGDFTRLASRLRESGMTVIGMGEEKTPRSFRAACNIFTVLENLVEAEKAAEEPEEESSNNASANNKKSQPISRKNIEDTVVSIITKNENNGKMTALGEVGSRLQNKYPDFDARNYGYSLLSKFLEELPNIRLEKRNSTIVVSLKDNKKSKEEILLFIENIVAEKGKHGIGLSELSNYVYDHFKNFNPKDYGYSQFYKMVQSNKSIEVTLTDGGQREARLK